MSNPLVAQRQDSTTWHSGINVLDDAAGVYQGVQSGSWIEGGIAAFGTGMDLLTMAMNPVGTLISYGLNWLIEHVKPLQDALNQLAGDADQIAAYAQTWKNVGQAVGKAAQDLAGTVDKDLANWAGAAADAYRANIKNKIDHINAAATCANTIGTVVEIVGVITGAVRGLVRDMVTQAVGDFIQDALEEVCSLGLGTPVVVAQVVEQVSAWLEKIGAVIKKLINSVEKLRPMMSKLEEIFAAIKKVMSELHGRPGEAEPHLPGEGSTHTSAADDIPANHGGTEPSGTSHNGNTTPSSAGDGTTPTSHAPDDPEHTSRNPTDGPANRPSNPDDAKTPAETRKCENDPVDVATGDMVLPQIDVELAGALPLVLRRVHVSSYRAGRTFGDSWASTVDQRLEFDAQGAVFVTEDGMLLVYPRVPESGEVFPVAGPRWPLARTEVGYRIRQPEYGWALDFTGNGDLVPLVTISNRGGDRIDFVRDEHGTSLEVRHSGGYHVRFPYEDGRIAGAILVTETGGEIGLLRYGFGTDGRVREVINSSRRPLVFEYDQDGRIISWTDRNDQWYRYLYDADGRCVGNLGAGGVLNGTFSYDPGNRITRFTDALGNTTTYLINQRNRVVAETDPLGNTTTQVWDEQDNLASRTDPLGHTTTFRYDESGDLVEAVRPDGARVIARYTDKRLLTELTEADGAVWRYEYDERGNRIATIDPIGTRTEFRWDEHGHLSGVRDGLGNVRTVRCNAAGLPVEVIDGLGNSTRYERDPFGRVVTISDAMGGVSRITWTVEGKPLSRQEPDGSVERWSYDAEGNLIAHADPLGTVTRTEYTYFDLPAATVHPDGTRTTFIYDAALRLTQVSNARGETWKYEYDAGGRLAAETDFNGRTVRYERDALGRLSRRTNGAGETVRFLHDAFGNLIARESSDLRETFRFDAAGRLVAAVNGDCELSYERDLLGRVVAETVNGRTVRSEYDALGRRVARVTASGHSSTWSYNANHQPVELRTGHRNLIFGYDLVGREIERLVDSGAMLAQTWDSRNRLTSQTLSTLARSGVSDAPVAVLQRRAYRYRPDGLLDAIEDAAGVRRFQFDPRGRVTQVDGARRERYTYDTTGAVTDAAVPSGIAGRRAYTGSMLQSADGLDLRYDAQGRVVMKRRKRLSRKPDVWHLKWNSDDRLVEVIAPDNVRWRYRYDPLGRRIAKQRLGEDGRSVAQQIDFVWDGLVPAEQHDSDRTVTTWDWAPNGFQPLTQTTRTSAADAPQSWIDERFYAIVTDMVGAPTELMDRNGKLAWVAERDLWGRTAARSRDGVEMPFRFPGQYHDVESGLHYNYARYYDPETARYTATDPAAISGGLDPHSYVPNPAQMIDPLGLVPCKVHIDNNAAIAAVENGHSDIVDQALNGRTPHVSQTVMDEFTAKGNGDALRSWLEERGGGVHPAASEDAVSSLRKDLAEANDQLKHQAQRRKFDGMDLEVAAAARENGCSILTADKRFYNKLAWLNIPADRLTIP